MKRMLAYSSIGQAGFVMIGLVCGTEDGFAAMVLYMAAYLLGSIVTMGIMLLIISLATFKSGRRSFRFLFGTAGGLSIVTGLFWRQKNSSPLI